MSKSTDLSGVRFGRLVAIAPTNERTSGNNIVLKCVCDCGNVTYVGSGALKIGQTKSCGCWRKDRATTLNKTHGGGHERLYSVWMDMRRRCNDPSMKGYQDYGGRGITLCDEWRDYSNFREWALSNGYEPTAQHGKCTLDRIDVDGNYEPSNCRWVSVSQQQLNKRNSLLLTYKGKTQNAALWDRELGFPRGTVVKRYRRNWDYERIFTQPVNTTA